MIKEITIEMDFSDGRTLSFVVLGKMFERNIDSPSGAAWWESDYNQHILLTKRILDDIRGF